MKKSTLALAVSAILITSFSFNFAQSESIPSSLEINFYNQITKQQLVSLDFNKTQVQVILNYLKQLTGVQFVLLAKMNKEISIHLKNVPWQIALNEILKKAHLSARRNGSMIVMMPQQKSKKQGVQFLKDEVAEIRQHSEKAKLKNNHFSIASDDMVMTKAAVMALPKAVAPAPIRVERASRGLQFASSNSAPTRMLGRFSGAALSYIAPQVETNTEKYQKTESNGVKLVAKDPVSTFSIDVDTGSYSNIRRIIQSGHLPPKDAVRIEELVNYFNYDYPASKRLDKPFSTSIEIAPSPWNKAAKLLHIGIKGYQPTTPRPASNLVFLLDVSGSMSSANKLPLLKASLKLLTKQLNEDDRISIVVYAGAAGVVLEPTRGDNQHKIINALEKLSAGGSTNGQAGIHLAYQLAEENYIKGGINRILIATDGDFNVGTSNIQQLKELIANKRKTGISLTTLGFGSGNYHEDLMEQIADVGNGNYAYIDSLKEANKVLVEQMNATLMTIAKDVKIQIEFNPNVVSQYRLIGYENRMLRNQDFANDKVDAGEIGAGHTVTALYELILTDNAVAGWVKPMRYAANKPAQTSDIDQELGHLRIRYKKPKADKSRLLETPLYQTDIKNNLADTSMNFRFASAVAGFAQLLKNDEYLKNGFNFDQVRQMAAESKGADSFGYRGEFLQLVSLAKSLAKPIKKPLFIDQDDDF